MCRRGYVRVCSPLATRPRASRQAKMWLRLLQDRASTIVGMREHCLRMCMSAFACVWRLRARARLRARVNMSVYGTMAHEV
jgi:hypothetical protein